LSGSSASRNALTTIALTDTHAIDHTKMRPALRCAAPPFALD
jgi:hypothetical protein